MNKYKIVIMTYLLIFSNMIFSQTDNNMFAEIKKGELYSYISNSVGKNILIYNIKTYPIENILNENKYIINNGLFNDFSLLPDLGYRFVMTINKINMSYPDTTYNLYSIEIGNYIFTKNDSDYVYASNSGSVGNYILVACKKKFNYIKYLSGNIFLNDITSDFNLDFNNPETFIDYIKIKTFNLKTSNIEYVKSKRNKIIFSAYSEIKKTNIRIIIQRNKYNNIIILST